MIPPQRRGNCSRKCTRAARTTGSEPMPGTGCVAGETKRDKLEKVEPARDFPLPSGVYPRKRTSGAVAHGRKAACPDMHAVCRKSVFFVYSAILTGRNHPTRVRERRPAQPACQTLRLIVYDNDHQRKDLPMTIDPIAAYSSRALAPMRSGVASLPGRCFRPKCPPAPWVCSSASWASASAPRTSPLPKKPAPTILKDFARELELQYLTQHVEPFKPAGSYSVNATTRRMGLNAYMPAIQPTRRFPHDQRHGLRPRLYD